MIAVGRPTWLEIHLAALVDNFRLVQRTVGEGVAIFPVVKANGYGLGAIPIALALQQAGAHGLCLAMAEEAALLQQAGVTLPMALLSSPAPGLEKEVVRQGWQVFLYTLADARRLHTFADPAHPLPVHVKVDTGMGRLGFPLDDLPAVMTELATLPGLKVVGLASHLACADEPQRPVTRLQMEKMESVRQQYAHLPVSLANSAGILAHAASHYQWVRPGIMIYGGSPFHPQGTASDWGIKPVVAWKSRIIQVREMAAGCGVGYGHAFITPTASRIALVTVGYADGYSRCLGNLAQVLIQGRRAPVVGRVSMDSMAVDITQLPHSIQEGEIVTLLGQDGQDAITAEELATWMDTIPYEVFCRLGQRMPKIYLREGT
ncbi:MAG: alanine racemase [Magnetococcales bacterium]|nr:alanine racemase [Magnetococcales bacterium]NGZ27041.1 alanine racemase [Magnetococcales bacterium]